MHEIVVTVNVGVCDSDLEGLAWRLADGLGFRGYPFIVHIGVGAQSTLGERHFCPKIYL